ncbi:GreA/GreB family elongation factor [Parahaliea mediterranea]|uniref:GreA/GreB family elongation factor n=1 Tax=Parahaliea mediterranea TaxID=651086 RepID=A0A939DEK1_9GAMM|nr:GreA/GreB family elongation factor [Parahaliea mediterranea]MBN7796629.1 GreA/GreB family elongation factor [Parahaliea mediterranea]
MKMGVEFQRSAMSCVWQLYGRPMALARLFDLLEKLQLGTARAGSAGPGCAVEVEDLAHREKGRFCLVGDDQARAGTGDISVFSPLGAALVGLRVGDIAEVRLGCRTHHFLILQINSIQQPLTADEEGKGS